MGGIYPSQSGTRTGCDHLSPTSTLCGGSAVQGQGGSALTWSVAVHWVRWPWEKHKWGADFSLHYPENPRASAPSGQLETKSEHHHPAPAQLILHGGRRLVISCHSQCLQLTGLGRSLPLICQQQPSLLTRGESAHTKGAPRVLSFSDRGGCATVPYRTPTALGHSTKPGVHSCST